MKWLKLKTQSCQWQLSPSCCWQRSCWVVEPMRCLENKGILHILHGTGSCIEVAPSINVLFLHKVKNILEVTPITSVCRPRRYSQAALSDVLVRIGSGEQLYPSCFTMWSVVDIAATGGRLLIKILYCKAWFWSHCWWLLKLFRSGSIRPGAWVRVALEGTYLIKGLEEDEWVEDRERESLLQSLADIPSFVSPVYTIPL